MARFEEASLATEGYESAIVFGNADDRRLQEASLTTRQVVSWEGGGRARAATQHVVLTVGVAVVIAALFLAAQLVIMRHKRKEELARATGGYHFRRRDQLPAGGAVSVPVTE